MFKKRFALRTDGSNNRTLCDVAAGAGLDSIRRGLVQAYCERLGLEAGQRLALLGALIDRLERGVRLV